MKAILGIETSCDETAAAVVTEDLRVLANVVATQIDVHARYGGVVPEIASRVHVSEIIPVISKAMADAGLTPDDLEAIGVTRGPGLIGSLLVGISAAKALSLCWKKPLIGVNHLEGHLASASLGSDRPEYPSLILLVSGGHTLIARASAPGKYRILGSTRDDSAGEAYDKLARVMGLGYPGGPVIDRLARDGKDVLDFPRPLLRNGLDFSFSGLKTAVINYVRSHPDFDVNEVSASFAAAVMDVLVGKLISAVEQNDVRSVSVVGGVAASPVLRERLSVLSRTHGIKVSLPPLAYATDNAAMIAAAAWPQFRARGGDALDFNAEPRWRLPQVG
ncbi:MAG TPA: tRNA (adenosine(37)-N6)-threonylcarbamoyltransferase complex transferase subunit TsaD [Thermoanaerobaculia bacterium]|nr:tRNA (adenosine(37)-N6)-threonylcarbamoyltransferase complex transferase subunit TsaD [Thermoanaerobaculia bacterium]